MIDCLTKTFYLPTLVNHLYTKFGLDVEVSSLFFVADMVTYLITLQFLNSVIEKLGLKMTMLSAVIFNSVTVLFLPPLDFLPQ